MSRPIALAAALALALAAPAVDAGEPVSNEPVRPAHMRLALSPAAASFMTEVRMRSLLEVELAGVLPLAEAAPGPLDEPAVRVYIDLPDAATVAIQVQAPGRPLTRRRLDVTGLVWDVAARFTALATAEVVRAQLAPVRVRRPRPHVPTAAELHAADRRLARWVIGAGLHTSIGAGSAAFGPELEIGHATRVIDTRLSGRYAARPGDGRLRAGEIGLAAQHRLHATPWLRAELGAGLAVGSAASSPPLSDQLGEAGPEESAGYGRLAARIGVGARIAPQTWLGLRVEPGIVVGGPSRGGVDRLDGPSLGLVFALSHDVPSRPPGSSGSSPAATSAASIGVAPAAPPARR